MVFAAAAGDRNTVATAAEIMGKINSYRGVEVIPVDTSFSRNNTLPRLQPGLFGPTQKMHRLPYLSDQSIVPRVQKYLEANLDKTYVDINVMADELQRKYREYAKRKRSAFRGSVKKAYAIVMRTYGVNDPQHTSSEEYSDESPGEEEVRYPDNSLNNQLMDMYGRNIPKAPVDANELIDISSDDSNEPSEKKSTNGPSTSQKNELSIIPQHMLETELLTVQSKELKLPALLFNERGKKRKSENQLSSLDRLKRKKNVANLEESYVTFKNVGGMDKTLEDVCKLLLHIKHPEVYRQIGISPPRGCLLHGPPGCGKTLLANAIAGELEVPLLKVSAPELVAGVSGESEQRIRELFDKAVLSAPCVLFIDEIDAITPNRQNAQKDMERRIVAQLLSCLDELNKNELYDQVLVLGATNRPDSLDPAIRRAGRFDREVCLGIPDRKAREQILKVLTSKLKLADPFDFETIAKFTPGFVGADLLALIREATMAAVNRTFDEIKEKQKVKRSVVLQNLEEQKKDPKPVEPEPPAVDSDDSKNEVDVVDVESNDKTENKSDLNSSDNAVVVIDDDVKQDKATPQSDVVNSTQPQSEEVVTKIPEALQPRTALEELIYLLHGGFPLTHEQLQGISVTMDDFALALKRVQPSAKREGFATVPDTTWDDIGSLREVRQELQLAILAPVRHEEQFKALGFTTPTGILLCGPPGCGKTLLAKAIANEAGINFISVKGPELLNMYVGESERAVRICFERARNSAPCVIFFDELDALCPKRSDTGENGASMRVVNQMLTEMDGIEGRQGVYLLAASNRPDIIDSAVLRPGRLDKILYVGLPSASDRVDILKTITKNGTKPLLAPEVDLEAIGKSEACDGYTGADLAALVREAGVEAIKEVMIQGDLQKALLVTTDHFKRAVAKIRPSVSEKDQKHYESLKKLYSPLNDVEEMEYS